MKRNVLTISLIKKIKAASFILSILFFFLPDLSNQIYLFGIDKDVKHFYQSLQSFQQSSKIINNGKAYSIINSSDSQAILSHYQRSLEQAITVSRDSLDARYPGLGNRYYESFIIGLESNIAALKGNDVVSSINAQKHLAEWDDWYIQHLEDIRSVLLKRPLYAKLPSKLCYFLAAIFFLIWAFLKVCFNANVLFWFKVKDHPDVAYDWFTNNQTWAVINDESQDYERYYPKKDWAGPFLLCVPKLNWQKIRIFGKADSLAKTQKEFLKLIQTIEN